MLFTKGLALACLSSSATGFTSPSFVSLNQNNRQAILLPIPSTTTATFSTVSDVYYDAFDIAEDSPRGMTFVLDIWAADHGIQKSNGFKLQEEDNGREIYAVTNEDAPAGTPILIVPKNLILSSNKAIAELRGYGIEEAEDDLINMIDLYDLLQLVNMTHVTVIIMYGWIHKTEDFTFGSSFLKHRFDPPGFIVFPDYDDFLVAFQLKPETCNPGKMEQQADQVS